MILGDPGDGDGICGVLLAAGAGRRAGGPKALRSDPDGTSWLLRSVGVLLEGGCRAVVVVLGCGADAARAMISGSIYNGDRRVDVVEAADWRDGMGHSLRAGLLAVSRSEFSAIVVHLVDLPDVTSLVVDRLLGFTSPGVLARATYRGQPGHPVLIGSDHWYAIADGLTGDRGARGYLDRHAAVGVECSDLATGRDHDQ
ncbi:MAG: NTP transferase domain-containing protein [Microlunatus sp.]|nr:NTP transferase domain-containing protein [Microlunatus sp.]